MRMKKLLFYVRGFYVCACLLAFVACSSGSRSEYQLTQEQKDSIDAAVDSLLQGYSAKYEVIIAAQKFVRAEFASNANFEDEGTIVEETAVPGRYKVLQKFSAEDHPSNWTHFVYRIWVQRFDDGSWEFGNLGVESITGENVLTTNGNMKKRERSNGVGSKLTVAGIEFTVAEQSPTAIRIYTKSKLSSKKMRDVVKELVDKYDVIQFATDAKHERGDEYATWSNGYFCNFVTNEVLSRDEFLK